MPRKRYQQGTWHIKYVLTNTIQYSESSAGVTMVHVYLVLHVLGESLAYPEKASPSLVEQQLTLFWGITKKKDNFKKECTGGGERDFPWPKCDEQSEWDHCVLYRNHAKTDRVPILHLSINLRLPLMIHTGILVEETFIPGHYFLECLQSENLIEFHFINF